MSTTVASLGDSRRERDPVAASSRASWLIAACGITLAAASALLVATAPLAASIGTLFAFAVPHNWMEARVFLSQVPPRWGPLRPSLLVGLVGTVLLAVSLPLVSALPWLSHRGPEPLRLASSAWLSALWLWIALVVVLRGRERLRDRGWAWPAALSLVAASWSWPSHCLLLLVYLHPLVALAFLWRAVRRRKPHWLPGLRLAMASAAASVLVLLLLLAGSADIGASDPVAWRIVSHAGAFVLPGVSSHLLVATHVHLEVLHYAAWLVAIPAVMLRSPAWRLTDVPLARRSRSWRVTIAVALACVAVGVVVSWAGFAADYAVTRDVYFTLAMLHVLTEVPFLVRLT